MAACFFEFARRLLGLFSLLGLRGQHAVTDAAILRVAAAGRLSRLRRPRRPRRRGEWSDFGRRAMNSGEHIWFNGKLVPADEAKVSVMAQALHYGTSVFEGIRAYATPKGPAIFCLPQHVRRMFDSCRIFRMELPHTAAEMTGAITETVRVNRFKECYIRPIAFRGAGSFSLDPRKSPVEVAVITVEWGRYLGAEAIEQGVDVVGSSWRRMAPDTGVPMGKIAGQYGTSQLITMEAADLGYAEGVALDASGLVSA